MYRNRLFNSVVHLYQLSFVADVQKALDASVAKFGAIHGVINSAGIGFPGRVRYPSVSLLNLCLCECLQCVWPYMDGIVCVLLYWNEAVQTKTIWLTSAMLESACPVELVFSIAMCENLIARPAIVFFELLVHVCAKTIVFWTLYLAKLADIHTAYFMWQVLDTGKVGLFVEIQYV